MEFTESLIRNRRSVRTFDARPLEQEHLDKLTDYLTNIPNPYGLPIEFRLLNTHDRKLSCPVAVGAELFVGGKMKASPDCCVAFGYSFEKLVLFAQSLGIGTVWVGGTMDRGAFERAMELSDGEVMPAVTPLGYPAGKMSLRETVMRKGIRAEERLPFDSVFFHGDFSTPMTQETAGALFFPLEMVRLGPSAVNKQPWRVLVRDNTAHFFLKRTRGFTGGVLDMQKLDMGIALCHFATAAEAMNMPLTFLRSDPLENIPDGLEYIASYRW